MLNRMQYASAALTTGLAQASPFMARLSETKPCMVPKAPLTCGEEAPPFTAGRLTKTVRHTVGLWLSCLALLVLGGCGMKGPLHLPKDKPAQSQSAPAPSAPATPAPVSQEATK